MPNFPMLQRPGLSHREEANRVSSYSRIILDPYQRPFRFITHRARRQQTNSKSSTWLHAFLALLCGEWATWRSHFLLLPLTAQNDSNMPDRSFVSPLPPSVGQRLFCQPLPFQPWSGDAFMGAGHAPLSLVLKLKQSIVVQSFNVQR